MIVETKSSLSKMDFVIISLRSELTFYYQVFPFAAFGSDALGKTWDLGQTKKSIWSSDCYSGMNSLRAHTLSIAVSVLVAAKDKFLSLGNSLSLLREQWGILSCGHYKLVQDSFMYQMDHHYSQKFASGGRLPCHASRNDGFLFSERAKGSIRSA